MSAAKYVNIFVQLCPILSNKLLFTLVLFEVALRVDFSSFKGLSVYLISVPRNVSFFCLTQPLGSLSVFPMPLLLRLSGHVKPNTNTIHQIVLILTNMSITIWELSDSLAIHFVIAKLTLVSSLIWPQSNTISFHLIVKEITFINFS